MTNACQTFPRLTTAVSGIAGSIDAPVMTSASTNMPGTSFEPGAMVASTISERVLPISAATRVTVAS